MITQQKKDYIVISLDSLTKALKFTFPETGITEKSRVTDISKKILPFIIQYLKDLQYDYPQKNYIIEGIQLNPDDFINESFFENTTVVCLGYPNASVEDIFYAIREHDKKLPYSYSKDLSNEELLHKIKFFISYSKFLKKKCIKYGIPFYETDKNREKILDIVFNNLMKQHVLDTDNDFEL